MTIQSCKDAESKSKKKQANKSKLKPSVLLVEDISIIQLAVSSILQAVGCDVMCATNGAYAVGNFQIYDLILLDIGLPDISGIEVCKRIRANKEGKKLPIIALTSHDDNETVSNCHKAGFDGYQLKPLTQENASLIIKQYLPDFAERSNDKKRKQ